MVEVGICNDRRGDKFRNAGKFMRDNNIPYKFTMVDDTLKLVSKMELDQLIKMYKELGSILGPINF